MYIFYWLKITAAYCSWGTCGYCSGQLLISFQSKVREKINFYNVSWQMRFPPSNMVSMRQEIIY